MTRRGFSLAEMMVAIGVLGIGLTMVACFFPVAMYQHADTMSQHRAMKIAREAKSLVLNAPFDPTPAIDTIEIAPNFFQPPDQYRPGERWADMISPRLDPGDLLDPGDRVADFSSRPRYVWYLLTAKDGAARKYFVAITRALPGSRFPQQGNPFLGNDKFWADPDQMWIDTGGDSLLPQLWSETLDPGTAADTRSLRPHNAYSLQKARDQFRPNTKLISPLSGLIYTVIDVVLHENAPNMLLREDLGPQDSDGGTFYWFPPAVDSDESPYVMGLFF